MCSHSHLSSKTISKSKKKIFNTSGLSLGKKDGMIIVRVLEEEVAFFNFLTGKE